MKKLGVIACLFGLLLMACTQDEWSKLPDTSGEKLVFKLSGVGYEGGLTRASVLDEVKYDRVAYYIVDEDGQLVKDFKTQYDPDNSKILVEGLHAGEYRLLVLGIRGDAAQDRATVYELKHASDRWLEFPSDLQKPLQAEYFYSQTPFSVEMKQTADGGQEVAGIEEVVKQKRIMGRVDFDFSFRNKYVSNSVISKTLRLKNARFVTEFSGEGRFSGESDGQMSEISLNDTLSYCFMPTVDGSSLAGEIEMHTRNYLGEEISQAYSFEQNQVEANRLNTVETKVQHPDDNSGTMFISTADYLAANHKQILQDDERKEIYSDAKQRSFDTSQPLQINITETGQLHLRFYCPRGMSGVLIKGKLPMTGDEYVDLAYLDTVPPFADFYEDLPLLERSAVYRTESGRQVEVSRQDASALQGGSFKAESESECWKRLSFIKYSLGFGFNLYGGDPDKPDGGPNGNWLGIRPVHCREMVAFYLNYAYLISMSELDEEIKKYSYHDDNKQPVTPETVLRQMRQYRYLGLGLVFGSVSGLANPSVWGVSEGVLKGLYNTPSSVAIAFHEFGHVMGYNHASSFTYGDWATKIMNNFYLKHLSKFPIDNKYYVDLENNEHLYFK